MAISRATNELSLAKQDFIQVQTQLSNSHLGLTQVQFDL